MNKPDINELTNSLKHLFSNPAIKDAESQVHQLLQSQIAKMGLVTREEFDAQTAVLQRSRQRLQDLEEKFEKLTK